MKSNLAFVARKDKRLKSTETPQKKKKVEVTGDE